MATRRQPRRRSRREQLLGLAADLFAERGFAGVTVDDIGAAAGVSGPALYHHFAGKEALLGEMLIGISQRLLYDAVRIERAAEVPGDVLDALVANHAVFAVDNPSLITVHHRDLVHAAEADRRRVRRLQARYVLHWVEALQHRSPGLDRRTAGAAVHATIGLVNSTPYSSRLPRDEMVDLLTVMAGQALAAIARSGRALLP